MGLSIESWILEVKLSDGRVVKIDVDKEAVTEIDSFLSQIENDDEIEDWIVKEV